MPEVHGPLDGPVWGDRPDPERADAGSPGSAVGGPRFMDTEATSGVLLVIAAAAALVWANSWWADSYETVWHTEVVIQLGPWASTRICSTSSTTA